MPVTQPEFVFIGGEADAMAWVTVSSHGAGLPALHVYMSDLRPLFKIADLKPQQAIDSHIYAVFPAVDSKGPDIVGKWAHFPRKLVLLRVGDEKPGTADIIEIDHIPRATIDSIVSSLVYRDILDNVACFAIYNVPKSILKGRKVHGKAIG
jgi:hypothetical protein